MLVVMGPVLQVSVARLYAAAILPGILLAVLYIVYTMIRVMLNPELGPPLSEDELNVPKSYIVREFFVGLVPVATLILVTLGTIMSGLATPTEGAALGCLGAVVVTEPTSRLTFKIVKESAFRTAETTSMVMILLAASTFMGAVFSSMGTPKFIADRPAVLEPAALGVRDRHPDRLFHPRVAPGMGPDRGRHRPDLPPDPQRAQGQHDLVRIVLAVTLQSCWISPPVALSAYYLKAIMPEWELIDIYKGMMPFMVLQAVAVALLYLFPQIVLWLPKVLFG